MCLLSCVPRLAYIFLWFTELYTSMYPPSNRVWRLFAMGSPGCRAGSTFIPGVPWVFCGDMTLAYHACKIPICSSNHMAHSLVCTWTHIPYYRAWRLFVVGSAGCHAERTCIPGVPCVFHAYHIIFHKISFFSSKHCPLCAICVCCLACRAWRIFSCDSLNSIHPCIRRRIVCGVYLLWGRLVVVQEVRLSRVSLECLVVTWP